MSEVKEMNENKTANLLAQLRKDKRLTQVELAEELGVTYQAVSKWERGENLPDSAMLVDIAKFYHITVDELLKGELINRSNLDRIKKRKFILMITSIILFVLSPISIFIYGVEEYQKYVPAILIIAAVATPMIIYATVSTSKLQSTNTEKSFEYKKIEDAIYAVCAGIFLILGLVWGLWYIAWVVFIFGFAINNLFNKKNRE